MPSLLFSRYMFTSYRLLGLHFTRWKLIPHWILRFLQYLFSSARECKPQQEHHLDKTVRPRALLTNCFFTSLLPSSPIEPLMKSQSWSACSAQNFRKPEKSFTSCRGLSTFFALTYKNQKLNRFSKLIHYRQALKTHNTPYLHKKPFLV